MAFSINVGYHSLITSEGQNDQVKKLVGINGTISGFNFTIDDVSKLKFHVGVGTAVIDGCLIEMTEEFSYDASQNKSLAANIYFTVYLKYRRGTMDADDSCDISVIATNTMISESDIESIPGVKFLIVGCVLRPSFATILTSNNVYYKNRIGTINDKLSNMSSYTQGKNGAIEVDASTLSIGSFDKTGLYYCTNCKSSLGWPMDSNFSLTVISGGTDISYVASTVLKGKSKLYYKNSSDSEWIDSSDADTVDGKHASNFADVDLESYVGYTDDDVYGVEVDFNSLTFVRLAGAVGKNGGDDFNSVNAFGGRRRCNVSDDGKVIAYYGDVGYIETGALTSDVTVGDVTYPSGTKVQVMVEQPRFYYKVVPLRLEKIVNGKGYHLRKARYYVSDTPKVGFKLHPAFIHDGKEVNYIYLSAYEGCVYDTSSSSYKLNDDGNVDWTNDVLSSIAGAKPTSGFMKSGATINGFRTIAAKRGSGWSQETVQAATATEILFLVEYASFNMQTNIGVGVTNKPNDTQRNSSSITGATTTLGNRSGEVIDSGGYSVISYRGEENFFGNIWKFIDGINVYVNYGGSSVYIADHGFTDETKDNPYHYAGITIAEIVEGYVSAFAYNEDFDWLFIASEASKNKKLSIGDYFINPGSHSEDYTIAKFGGDWDSGSDAGGFCWDLLVTTSSYRSCIGGRLLYLPDGTDDLTSKDLNDYKATGNYFINSSNYTNCPSNCSGALEVANCEMYIVQTYTPTDNTFPYTRVFIRESATWGTWLKVNDCGNADTVDGKHASEFLLAIGTDNPTDTDLDNYKTSGRYSIGSGIAVYPKLPCDHSGILEVLNCGSYIKQVYTPNTPSKYPFVRLFDGYAWDSWIDIGIAGGVKADDFRDGTGMTIPQLVTALEQWILSTKGNFCQYQIRLGFDWIAMWNNNNTTDVTGWGYGWTFTILTPTVDSKNYQLLIANELDQSVYIVNKFEDTWGKIKRINDNGNARTISDSTDTMKLYAEQGNEVNFGGSYNGNVITFGFRAKDSRPIPNTYKFGANGTAEVLCNLLGTWMGYKLWVAPKSNLPETKDPKTIYLAY